MRSPSGDALDDSRRALVGVALIAAILSLFVNVVIASSISVWVLSLHLAERRLLMAILYAGQFVRELCSLGGHLVVVMDVLMVAMIGVWSDDKSKLDWMSVYEDERPEMTKKSSRSGVFLGSVGQYVGDPVDSTE